MADTVHLTFQYYEVLAREDGSPYELGRGAMGITYKALDTRLRREVALKVINESCFANPAARKRFLREARSAARLRHANIASVFHLGENEAGLFYAMELVDGETVQQLIRRQGKIETLMALRIVQQVCRALAAAHKCNIIHRDIKPSNLMLVSDDDELLVKVIDFGLAKQVGGGPGATVTVRGFLGTPHYASPEQLNEQELDVRSDIYSLGVTLWQMLAGQPPFVGTIGQIMSQHLSAPAPVAMLGDQPPAVQRLLKSMLAKDPADRPQTPLELGLRIKAAIEAITLASTASESASVALFDSQRDVATCVPGERASPTLARPATIPVAVRRAPTGSHASPVRPAAPLSATRRGRAWLAAAAIALSIGAAGSAWFLLREPHAARTPTPATAPAHPETARPTAKRADLFQTALAAVDAARRKGDMPLALQLGAEAVTNFPEFPQALSKLGEIIAAAAPQNGENLGAVEQAMALAAKAGAVPAMLFLGNHLSNGDPQRAMEWYEKASQMGEPRAMTKLGLLWAKGTEDRPPDMDKAREWFLKASEAGDPEGTYALAECYLRGLGSLERDPKRATDLLKQAAAQNDPRALDLLGTCYSKGDGVPRDDRLAVDCYERAVQLDYAPSMANLGVLLIKGRGPTRKREGPAALDLFRRGAERGEPIAMFYYAAALEQGLAGTPDRALATGWYQAAAAAGNAQAIDWCTRHRVSPKTR